MADTTKKQRKAAAGHSKALRDRKREAGIPTGRQIDTALVSVLVRAMFGPKGLTVHAGHAKQLIGFAIQLEGWTDSEPVREALESRMLTLRQRAGAG